MSSLYHTFLHAALHVQMADLSVCCYLHIGWYSRQTHAYCEDPDVVLCGNKCDMEDRRVISEQRAREMAEKYGLDYLETSAATGHNVARAVELLVERVMRRMETAVDRAMLPGRRGRPRQEGDPSGPGGGPGAAVGGAGGGGCSC